MGSLLAKLASVDLTDCRACFFAAHEDARGSESVNRIGFALVVLLQSEIQLRGVVLARQ